MERRDIVIVGGGPAGSGTALALERLDPALARRALVLDRATFPRDKTCAGGLIPHTLSLLADLGLGLDVPHVRVDRAHVEAGGAPIEIAQRGCCWVVRRRELDHFLLEAARRRGIEVAEDTHVRRTLRRGDRIVLETSRGEIEARAVVGADGAGSVVRRSLVDGSEGWLARATMCDLPIEGAAAPDHYEFDFRVVQDGVLGYTWAFPCLIGGRAHWNVGVYSLRRTAEGARIARLVRERSGGVAAPRHAHPIRLYRGRDPRSAPGVLLAGDAAGVDPLLGEGISYALEYGWFAARALSEGFAAGDLSFSTYDARIRRSAMGRKLGRLALLARLFYGRNSGRWFWVARLSRRAQRIGMNWYNGVTSEPARPVA